MKANFRVMNRSGLLFGLVTWLCVAFAMHLYAQEKAPVEKLTDADLTFCEKHDLMKYAKAAEKWKAEAIKLSQKNLMEGSKDAVLCLGSSSIRLWDSIDEDMKPYKMIRRGYGGARYCDLAIHTPTLIKDLEYRAVMIFVGNDVTGGELDKNPEEVARLSKLVMSTIREQKPAVPVFLIAVTPTPSRFKHWTKIQGVNEALASLARVTPNTFFIPTQNEYLNSNNEPRPELFIKDMLHQNRDGYQLWASILLRSLNTNLKP